MVTIIARLLDRLDRRFFDHRYVSLCLWIGGHVPDFHECEAPGCITTGRPCYYPDHAYGHGPDRYYCHEHIRVSGFCSGCGLFSAGIESFEFDPDNLCDDCRHEIEMEERDWDTPEYGTAEYERLDEEWYG